MTLAAGTRIGPYVVQSPLGAGGMGEVYRATDSRLNRDVALKVVSQPFVADPERLARFEREAQILAALNHPHIAGVYGLEQADGARVLAMALVEGGTLADRLGAGAMPIAEALAIAAQIANALQAAHDRGIVHRDLKPANIALTTDGQVKVLDFGLAKVNDPNISSASNDPNLLTVSPTLTLAATAAGVVLGTAAYMAPEQARGKPADKRADVWAFGCVLYEMLTGRRPFEGEDASQTMAFVMAREPDWTAIPAAVPPLVASLLRRCLDKDPRRRVGDVAAVLFALEHGTATIGAPPGDTAATPLRMRLLPIAASALLTGVLAAALAWSLKPPAAPPVTRFGIELPPDVRFTSAGWTLVAVSPDGSHVAYVANNRLYLRARDRIEAVAVSGTEGGTNSSARGPFFSPDSAWLGFWHAGQLKKAAVAGSAPVMLADTIPPSGAHWAANDLIYYAGVGGIWRVPAAGGRPEQIVTLESGKVAYGPELLPGDDALMFTVVQGRNWDTAEIVLDRLDGTARDVLIRGGADARYVPTGHLVYSSRGSVLAVPFDLDRKRVTGGPVTVVDEIARSAGGATGAAHFSLSREGTLVYVPALSVNDVGARQFVWVDRGGRELAVASPPRQYSSPKVSPDGSRVLYQDGATAGIGAEQDVWSFEFRRGLFERLTTGPWRDGDAVWSPDGLRIAYYGQSADGQPGVFVRAADGTGEPEQRTTGTHLPNAWTTDGQGILYTDFGKAAISPFAETDIALTTASGERRSVALVAGPAREGTARLSPDGRWLAHESSETGEMAIVVRPFPDAAKGRWRISSGEGRNPVWAKDGRTLFYRSGRAVMAVAIKGTTPADWGVAETLFEGSFVFDDGPPSFDVAPDGRFLMMKTYEAPTARAERDALVVVQHWFEELKRLVPVN